MRVEATRYLDLGVDAEQGEECVHVNQGLSGLSVHCAQEIEGKRELEEQAVHHHQVSHGHRSCTTTTENLSATVNSRTTRKKIIIIMTNKLFLLLGYGKRSMLKSESNYTHCDFIFCIKGILFAIHATFSCSLCFVSTHFYYPFQSGLSFSSACFRFDLRLLFVF